MVWEIERIRRKTVAYALAGLFFTALPGFCQSDVDSENTAASQQQPLKTIRFAMSEMEHTYSFRLSKLVYTEAFKRMGYAFKQYALPSERALIESNSGRLDGESGRLAFDSVLTRKYPNLIRIPEVVSQINNCAFTLDSTEKITGWNILKNGGYKVGYVRGSKAVEQKVDVYVTPELRFELRNLNQGFEQLKRRRIDLLIGAVSSVHELLLEPRYKDLNVFNAGSLMKLDVYPYLHKKHRLLIPALVQVIQDMKKDGTIDRCITEVRQSMGSEN